MYLFDCKFYKGAYFVQALFNNDLENAAATT